MGPDGHGVWEAPCSGFVVHDESRGQVCAGFRQCHGTRTWPNTTRSGVPLELRCADDRTFANWSDPQFIDAINPNFNRHEPYDPVRPWVDADGQWYVALSLDACNLPSGGTCAAGGQLQMWTSPSLRGPKSDWRRIGPLFTANMTKSGAHALPGAIRDVFVTSDYIGGLRGDPLGGVRSSDFLTLKYSL